MASFHLSIKSGKKGSAANHAAYIAREGKHGKDGKQSDLIATAHGNLPYWADENPTKFWASADKHERVNGAAYREYEVALPSELTVDQQKEIINEFIQSEIGIKPFQYAIHSPTAALGGNPQPHAHIMVSDRLPDDIDRPAELHFKRHNSADPELGGCKKDSGGKDRAQLREKLISTRANWARIQNTTLEKSGHEARVDHRSNKARGINTTPERHLGHLGIKKMSSEEKIEYAGRRKNK
ncbi:MobA/MobL family protein [Undibacterium sp.]|uniref:MobA/MobL family protein n=1 Tax=Undibacterium sp. TaxID=1914977 RepID=UPI0025D69840|nr:MobA/MobL family protein [Undibacterium sp.]